MVSLSSRLQSHGKFLFGLNPSDTRGRGERHESSRAGAPAALAEVTPALRGGGGGTPLTRRSTPGPGAGHSAVPEPPAPLPPPVSGARGPSQPPPPSSGTPPPRPERGGKFLPALLEETRSARSPAPPGLSRRSPPSACWPPWGCSCAQVPRRRARPAGGERRVCAALRLRARVGAARGPPRLSALKELRAPGSGAALGPAARAGVRGAGTGGAVPPRGAGGASRCAASAVRLYSCSCRKGLRLEMRGRALFVCRSPTPRVSRLRERSSWAAEGRRTRACLP